MTTLKKATKLTTELNKETKVSELTKALQGMIVEALRQTCNEETTKTLMSGNLQGLEDYIDFEEVQIIHNSLNRIKKRPNKYVVICPEYLHTFYIGDSFSFDNEGHFEMDNEKFIQIDVEDNSIYDSMTPEKNRKDILEYCKNVLCVDVIGCVDGLLC